MKVYFIFACKKMKIIVAKFSIWKRSKANK